MRRTSVELAAALNQSPHDYIESLGDVQYSRLDLIDGYGNMCKLYASFMRNCTFVVYKNAIFFVHSKTPKI